MMKSHPESSEGRPSISQMAHLTHPAFLIQLQDDPYQLQNENEIMTKRDMTNSEEDHLNESLITLLNGQQDLQKQSLNMMLDITHRHKHDNLMRGIPIYD